MEWKGGEDVNCSEFKAVLDRYADGELSVELLAAFHLHADSCKECDALRKAAYRLQELLSHMDDDVSVPLPVQAAWRKAVRAEAQKGRRTRMFRIAGAIAAVCVLSVGTMMFVRNSPAPQVAESVLDQANLTSVAYVETDGVKGDSMLDAPVANDNIRYDTWVLYVDDVESAASYIRDIVAEYEGYVDAQTEDALSVRVTGANAADFVQAVGALNADVEAVTFAVDTAAEWVGIQLVLKTA